MGGFGNGFNPWAGLGQLPLGQTSPPVGEIGAAGEDQGAAGLSPRSSWSPRLRLSSWRSQAELRKHLKWLNAGKATALCEKPPAPHVCAGAFLLYLQPLAAAPAPSPAPSSHRSPSRAWQGTDGQAAIPSGGQTACGQTDGPAAGCKARNSLCGSYLQAERVRPVSEQYAAAPGMAAPPSCCSNAAKQGGPLRGHVRR